MGRSGVVASNWQPSLAAGHQRACCLTRPHSLPPVVRGGADALAPAGHEPAHAGFVGTGMLTAAVRGAHGRGRGRGRMVGAVTTAAGISDPRHRAACIPLPFPPYSTVAQLLAGCPGSLRMVAARDGEQFSLSPEDALESQLLACLGGHNLCCDVFGAHSKGEVANSGLSFHGGCGASMKHTNTKAGVAPR